MNAVAPLASGLSEQARQRFLAENQKPTFFANWERALFIHYESEAAVLQRQVPFELDLWHDMAIVTIVAFSMRRFRPAFGGRLLEWLFRPFCNHEFFNVRAYVRHDDRPGIFFMTEWINNRLSLVLGPALYGLPYRYGRIAYRHYHELGRVNGLVNDSFHYAVGIPIGTHFQASAEGSLDEFLLERYSAYTYCRGIERRFNIWHAPWPQCPVDVEADNGLLNETGNWFSGSARIGANYSPGLNGIWIGKPERLSGCLY